MFARCPLTAVTAIVLCGCSLDFDPAKIPNGNVRPGVDGAVNNPPKDASSADLGPLALWWFAEEGMPASVPDRAKGGLGIDLFPVLSSDVGKGKVEQGVWVSDRGILRSDPGPGSKLAAAIAKSQAISLEAWAEANATFEGNANLVGCEFFSIKQTRVGTETFLQVENASPSTPITLLPPSRLRHIVATYSAQGGVQRIYLDADEAATADMRKTDPARTNIDVPNEEIRVSIGATGWVGKVHLAAIYDKELTPAQVRALFGAGSKRR